MTKTVEQNPNGSGGNNSRSNSKSDNQIQNNQSSNSSADNSNNKNMPATAWEDNKDKEGLKGAMASLLAKIKKVDGHEAPFIQALEEVKLKINSFRNNIALRRLGGELKVLHR